MMETKKVPDLRFREFAEDWKQEKFGNFAHRLSAVQISSPNLPGIEYEDVIAGEGLLNKDVRKKNLSKRGIMFNGGQVLYGKLRPYLHNWLNPGFKGVAVGDWWVLNPVEINQTFLYTLIQTKRFDYVANISAGSKMPRADWNLVSETSFDIPVSKDEQYKISSLFNSLDRAVNFYKGKYAKLVALKKSMLEKMFPQGDSKVPELRFKGFSDDWEQRKLSDIAYSFEYGLNAAGKDYDGLHKYLRITDIDDSTHEFLQNNLTSPDADLSKCGNYKLQNGDIVFARTGASVGKTYIYKESDGLVYFAGFLIRIKIKPNYDAEFIFQNTLTSAYDKYIRITSQRSGQPGVNAKEYGDYTLMVPTLREQEKIGKYMRNIDSLIGFYQHKAEKLQSIKKFMLEKMFI